MFSIPETRILAVLVLWLSWTASFCLGQQGVADAAISAKPAIADAPFQSRTPRYKIAPGDSFDLNFELSPEFNQTGVAVQPDGFVTLRGIGDIKVQGQTCLLYTSPSPRDLSTSRMPSSA